MRPVLIASRKEALNRVCWKKRKKIRESACGRVLVVRVAVTSRTRSRGRCCGWCCCCCCCCPRGSYCGLATIAATIPSSKRKGRTIPVCCSSAITLVSSDETPKSASLTTCPTPSDISLNPTWELATSIVVFVTFSAWKRCAMVCPPWGELCSSLLFGRSDGYRDCPVRAYFTKRLTDKNRRQGKNVRLTQLS